MLSDSAKFSSARHAWGRLRRRARPAWVLGVAGLACAGAITAAAATGRKARSPKPQSGAAQEAAPGNVLRATLENGLRVVIVRDTLAPVVTTEVNFLVGSNEAPEGFPGLAHAQEHMMFRGNPGLTADQLADITAAMGGDFNADTQQTVTQYFFTVPAEDVDVALHIAAIRMSGVDNSQAEWEKERGAIEQEVASDLSDPEYVFYTQLLEALFHGTPYAHDALGTRPSFEKTTAAMLKDFFSTWYAPNNAILVVAGDVDPESVLAEVRKLFSGIPAKKLPARPEIHLQPVEARSLALPSDFPVGLVLVSFRLPGYGDPDFAAAEVLADVLSSQRGTLYDLVPEGKALFAGFAIEGLPGAGLGYAMAAFPKGADSALLVKQVDQILQDDLKNGLPADLVEAAKGREAAEAETRRNSISGLAEAWSDALAIEGLESPQQDVEAIEKVTPEDVDRVARKYLSFDHAISAVLTPQPSGKPISGKGFGGAESFAPSATKPTPLPEWAATALARLAVPPSTVHPVVTTLPNGLKLIVQPESVSDTIGVYGSVHTQPDLETPAKQDGVNSVLGELFSYGTTTFDRVAFQKALDDIAGDESAGDNSFSLTVLASHFDRGVGLLADNVLHPALPAPAFQTVQRQEAAAVAGQLQSPSYLATRAMIAALVPKGDPTLRQATPQSVMSLTLGHVRNYYERVFRPDLTTIVVIGKVTPGEARSVIEKYFGSWPSSGPKPEVDLPPIPRNASSSTTVPDTSRVQDAVTLAENLPMTRFSNDYYALELGNHVLGGGFYATRLYRDLREKAGLVYYVGVTLNAGRTRTTYTVDYGCDPPKVAQARGIVVRNLREMQTAPVTAAELRQAKALMLREIPLGESDTAGIAGQLLYDATMGLPLDEPTIAASHFLALTAAEVEAAFAKWIRPADLTEVVQGPAPQ